MVICLGGSTACGAGPFFRISAFQLSGFQLFPRSPTTRTGTVPVSGLTRFSARENEVVEVEETRHGRRYIVDGPLTAPDGTSLNIRTAWYINPGGDAPRFVTAHPLPKL